ncbi:hypothetical protein [Streptomyces aureoversilis]|uniref:Uncharacterized protein n=1 Tax=Streptomyces aureoversilis TaxID=67277 RepID=A0ABV9ZSE8_9ACTN
MSSPNERRRAPIDTHAGEAVDWQRIWGSDCAVPAGVPLDELVDLLFLALRDPDPLVRDGDPYVVLRTWIRRDVIDRRARTRLVFQHS